MRGSHLHDAGPHPVHPLVSMVTPTPHAWSFTAIPASLARRLIVESFHHSGGLRNTKFISIQSGIHFSSERCIEAANTLQGQDSPQVYGLDLVRQIHAWKWCNVWSPVGFWSFERWKPRASLPVRLLIRIRTLYEPEPVPVAPKENLCVFNPVKLVWCS